jgi:hypothetical protein
MTSDDVYSYVLLIRIYTRRIIERQRSSSVDKQEEKQSVFFLVVFILIDRTESFENRRVRVCRLLVDM